MSARVISLGAAVQDVFLSGKVFTPKKEDNGDLVEEFMLGSKLDVEGITFSTGGGATNAAVTFARQGLTSLFMGQIGDDPAGEAVIKELLQEKVDTGLLVYSDEHATGYSVLLLAPSGERTILTYRGASTYFKRDSFKLEGLEADWLYLSSLAGNMELLEAVIATAKQARIRVAINPGKGELKQTDWLKHLLHQVDVLIVNKDEIQQLVEGETDELLVRYASDMAPTTIMTDGPNGSIATNRQQIVKAWMYEDVPVVDRTGAGDAFGSGFVAALIKGKDLPEAVKFASANSTSVVQQIGAKAGILRGDVKLHDMPLEVTAF